MLPLLILGVLCILIGIYIKWKKILLKKSTLLLKV